MPESGLGSPAGLLRAHRTRHRARDDRVRFTLGCAVVSCLRRQQLFTVSVVAVSMSSQPERLSTAPRPTRSQWMQRGSNLLPSTRWVSDIGHHFTPTACTPCSRSSSNPPDQCSDVMKSTCDIHLLLGRGTVLRVPALNPLPSAVQRYILAAVLYLRIMCHPLLRGVSPVPFIPLREQPTWFSLPSSHLFQPRGTDSPILWPCHLFSSADSQLS